MKKYLSILAGVLIVLFGSVLFTYAAGCTPFLVAQGGTGVCNLNATLLLFGNGTGQVATSSSLFYTTARNELSYKYGSTTAVGALDSFQVGRTATTSIVGNNGTSTFAGGIASTNAGGLSTTNGLTITGGNFLLSSGATSTANNGITLSAGCFAIGSTCMTSNTGTVTSVSGSGGTTGLTLTGGAITTSGTLTLGGTLGIANGGTNATSFFASSTLLTLWNGQIAATSTSPLYVDSLNATSTTKTSTFLGSVSVSSSTLSAKTGLGIATSTVFSSTIGCPFASTTQTSNIFNINWSQGNCQSIILGANSSIVFNSTSSVPYDGMHGLLDICNTDVAYTTTFPNSVNDRWYGITPATSTMPGTYKCLELGVIYRESAPFMTNPIYKIASTTGAAR